ncbi:TPA: hypothetical protein ACGO0I_000444 [Streptococcus suis]
MKKTLVKTVILLAASCLLVACSSKKQESQSSTSTSQTSQSSNTQTSTSSTETTTSSNVSTDTSQQSQENQSTQESESLVSSTTTHSQLLALPATSIPNDLVGKWQGSSQQARHIDMEVTADGTITVTNDFRQSEDEDASEFVQTFTATISDLVEYKPNHFIIRNAENQVSALLPGMTGLGGRITPGFILENGQYKVILWGNPMDASTEATYDLVTEPQVFVTLDKVD